MSAPLPHRDRMLDAVTRETALRGYENVTVAQITARARVSLSTFYEHFSDRESCFLAAHRALAEQLSSEIDLAVTDPHAPAQAWGVAVRALLEFAEREPAAFSLLTHEAMIVGARGMDERDRLTAKLEASIERAWKLIPTGAPVPDMPAKLLLGGVIRSVGIQTRRGEHHPTRTLEDTLAWADAYTTPAGAERWRDPTPSAALPPPPNDSTGPTPPPVLPKGRHSLSPRVVADVQRERILHATADTIRAKGYTEITVADITAAAGISRETFYTYFPGKREAFLATRNLVFEQAVAASAGAFFTASTTWPERVWDSALAFAHFALARPSFAHFGYVETYALGRESTAATDEGLLAFTIFLADGYRWRAEAAHVSRLAAQAIACAMMELSAYYVRHERGEELWGLLPLVVYTILTPFMGIDAANDFIDRKLGRDQIDTETARFAGPSLDEAERGLE
jgi:AcrR family transcriptional regulator